MRGKSFFDRSRSGLLDFSKAPSDYEIGDKIVCPRCGRSSYFYIPNLMLWRCSNCGNENEFYDSYKLVNRRSVVGMGLSSSLVVGGDSLMKIGSDIDSWLSKKSDEFFALLH